MGALTIPGFEVFEEVARGPSGAVYRAESKRTKTALALKVIDPARVAEAGFLTQFERETASAGALFHGGIARVEYRSLAGEHLVLANAWLPNDLQATLGAPQAPALAAKWVKPVGEALDFAHRRGVVHGGLSPSNVRFSDEGAVVTDFRLALLRPRPTGKVAAWVAPELLDADRMPGPRSDVFSLAALLFEALTGAAPPRPFAGKPDARLSSALNEVFSQALATDPEARPQRMGALLAALGEATPAPVSTPSPAEVEVRESAVVVTLGPQLPGGLKSRLKPLADVLARPGPWSVAYSLSGNEWSADEVAVFVELHRRFQHNLKQVAFSSSAPLARGCAVLVCRSVEKLRSKTFAQTSTMLQWLTEEAR